MTRFHVTLSKRSIKDLNKLDPSVSKAIYSWITKNLEGCEDPRVRGKQLKGNLVKFWRYRVGDYRILCEIKDQKVVIIVVAVGHCKEIYDD